MKKRLKDFPEYAGLLHHALTLLERASKLYGKRQPGGPMKPPTPIDRLRGIVQRLNKMGEQTADELRYSIPASDATLSKPGDLLEAGIRYIEQAWSFLGGQYPKVQGAKGGKVGPPVNANVDDEVILAHNELGTIVDELTQVQDLLDGPDSH